MTYEITEADENAFTHGDCWALAKEISKRTGWPVHAFGAYLEPQPEGAKRRLSELHWVHMLVKTPDGNYLDVTGLSGADDVVEAYADYVEVFYGWEGEYFHLEEVRTESDWALLSRHWERIFPAAPVGKVAASLITAYRAGGLTPRTFFSR